MKLPEWADAADTEPGTMGEPEPEPKPVSWPVEMWRREVERTTDYAWLRNLARGLCDELAAERAKQCETCAYGHREDAGMVCNNDTYPGCLFDMAVPDNFCCTLWEARTIDIEPAAEFVRE